MEKPPVFAERTTITKAERDELMEDGLPPIVARMVVEIRSDGSRTVARGALEDLQNGERVALRAEAGSPVALAAQLARSLVQIPSLAKSMSETAAKEMAQAQLDKLKKRLAPLSNLAAFSRGKKKDAADG